MSVSEKKKKSISKTTSKLVLAIKKSLQSLDPFLDYFEASSTLNIVKVICAEPLILRYKADISILVLEPGCTNTCSS